MGKFFKNRSELRKKDPKVFRFLKINRPELLDELLPPERIKKKSCDRKKDVLDFSHKYNRRPNAGSRDSCERSLGAFVSIIRTSSKKEDVEFTKKFDALYPPLFTSSSVWERKFLNFVETNKKKPSQHSKNKEESSLGTWYSRYKNKFPNILFVKKIEKKYPSPADIAKNKKSNFEKFIKTNKRRPSAVLGSKYEKSLAIWYREYRNYGSDKDYDFIKMVEEKYPTRGSDWERGQMEKKYRRYLDNHSKTPQRRGADAHERSLANWFFRFSKLKPNSDLVKYVKNNFKFKKTCNEMKKEYLEFLNKNSRRPRQDHGDESILYRWYRRYEKLYPDDYFIKIVRSRFQSKNRVIYRGGRFKDFENFLNRHKRKPSGGSSDKVEASLYDWFRNYKKKNIDPEFVNMIESKYTTKGLKK